MKFLKVISILMVLCLGGTLLSGCQEQQNKLSKEKQQLLAYGGILGSRNGDVFDTLQTTNPLSKKTLEEYWDINDKKSAIETLDWLVTEGHRIDCDAVLKVLKDGNIEEYPQLKDVQKLYEQCNNMMISDLGIDKKTLDKVDNIGAWDYDRLVNVARWCYDAQYITEEETWKYINEAKQLSQKSFDSWEEYYISHVYGRSIAYDGDPKELLEVGKKLLKDENSIWKTRSFK